MYRASFKAVQAANKPLRATARAAKSQREAERRIYGLGMASAKHPVARLNR